MEENTYSQMTDQELMLESKKMKSFSITNAFLIGFLFGVIVFSIVKSTWGMLTLIPLYFIYRMINDPRNKKLEELKTVLKNRGLKW